MTEARVMEVAWMLEVRAILTEADASAWRAERADDLRRRVTTVVAAVRTRLRERTGAHDTAVERTHALVTTMESALPTEATRARWAAFVGVVHPEYEALILALPKEGAPSAVRPTNLTRSFFHCISAMVGVVAVGLIPSRSVIIGIAVAFAVYAWTMELGRRFSTRMNDWLMRLYARVSHPHERYRVNSATWYCTALLLLSLFATRPATMAALAVLGVADPVAALVGRRWGKHRFKTGRSLEGMLGFIASGTIVAAGALACAGGLSFVQVFGLALLGATVGGVVEAFTTKLDDNLTIPVAVGGAITLAQALL